MRVHRNAKTTPKGRALIVQRVETDGWSVAATAAAFGVSGRTVYKWRRRYRNRGAAGLVDGSSVPRHMPAPDEPGAGRGRAGLAAAAAGGGADRAAPGPATRDGRRGLTPLRPRALGAPRGAPARAPLRARAARGAPARRHHAAIADHLDVLGHFRDASHDPPHVDWLVTGSGFDRARFEALWGDVTRFLTAGADATEVPASPVRVSGGASTAMALQRKT